MIRNYLLLAWKVLMRRKFFTFISLFGICFTLTVLLVVTALLDAALVPQAPETKLDRTLTLHTVVMKSPDGNATRSGPAGYGLLDRHVRTLQDVELVSVCSSPSPVTVYHNGDKVTMDVRQTDAAFWQVFDCTFLEGRPFTAQEEENARPVAVINAAMRDRLFGPGPATGKHLNAAGRTFRIIGVVANVSRFRFNSYADIWVPISTMQTAGYRDELMGLFKALVVARDRQDFGRIRADFQAQLEKVVFPDPKKMNHIEAGLDTHLELVLGDMLNTKGDSLPLQFFALLALFSVLFMCLPAINLVNINMSRIMERASEIGVRKSFGASSGTLVGQFVVENLVLVLLGGAASLLGAYGVLALIERSELLPYASFSPSIRVFLYALAASVVFALLSGVYPAWRMARLHPAEALKGGRS